MSGNFFGLAIGDLLLRLVVFAIPILIALVLHELAHGGVAYLLGDPTAKQQGRLTLNPLKHLDPLGTLLFVIVRFGWGKPVPVDGRYFQHPRRDMALVSAAGPATNLLCAFIAGIPFKLGLLALPISYITERSIDDPLAVMAWLTVQMCVILGVFNLLPIPPLDGSRLVSAILPVNMLKVYEQFEGYGIAILFAMMFFLPGGFWRFLNPFVGFFNQLFLV